LETTGFAGGEAPEKRFRSKHRGKRAANSSILKTGKLSLGEQYARLRAAGQVMQME